MSEVGEAEGDTRCRAGEGEGAADIYWLVGQAATRIDRKHNDSTVKIPVFVTLRLGQTTDVTATNTNRNVDYTQTTDRQENARLLRRQSLLPTLRSILSYTSYTSLYDNNM